MRLTRPHLTIRKKAPYGIPEGILRTGTSATKPFEAHSITFCNLGQ